MFSPFTDVESYMDHILKAKKSKKKVTSGERKRKLPPGDNAVADLNDSDVIRNTNGLVVKSQKSYKTRLLQENSVNSEVSTDYETQMQRLNIEANQNIHFA